jgi:hypothetical protein
MHLLIPFASALSEACVHTLRGLALPQLSRALQRLTPARLDEGDEYSLSPPHERAIAAEIGLSGADGCLPWAARAAAAEGIDTANAPWGLLTPVHWQVGSTQVTLIDPGMLGLSEQESRKLFDSVRDLFETEGFTLVFGGADRWFASHPSFEQLPTASIDRVIGRGIDAWMPRDQAARLVRRLQNEVQMTLYEHPLTDERVGRRELPVNSFWLSGCGRLQAERPAPELQVDSRLRQPLMSDDWAGWAEAWRALDGGPLRRLNELLDQKKTVVLTLCGDRNAQRFESRPRGLWDTLAIQWRKPQIAAVLEAL